MKFIKTIIFTMIIGSSLLVMSDLSSFAKTKPEAPKVELEQKELHPTIEQLETLFVLMQERLGIMHDVARYKWNHGQNLESLKGEDIMIDKNMSEPVKAFLTAQNQAAKQLQEEDFQLFAKEKVDSFESVKDFQTTLLAELKLLNTKITENAQEVLLRTQADALPAFLKEVSFTSFKHEGINKNIYETAVEPLFHN